MAFKFEKYSVGGGGNGGGSGIIDVTELPTENIDESAVYRVNGYADINALLIMGTWRRTLEQVLTGVGYNPSIQYFVVSDLPSAPSETNLVTFNPAYCYIYNNIPHVYGNAGYGNMWLPVSALLAQVGLVTEDRGFVDNLSEISGDGLYVTYSENPTASTITTDFVRVREQWVKSSLLSSVDYINSIKVVTADDLRGLTAIRAYMFSGECTAEGSNSQCDGYSSLEEITIPENIVVISDGAFESCPLRRVEFISNKVTTIGEWAFASTQIEEIDLSAVKFVGDCAFFGCEHLRSVTFGVGLTKLPSAVIGFCNNLTTINYNGTKTQWKTIEKTNDWYNGAGNYTIYCTDGTIAADGTET